MMLGCLNSSPSLEGIGKASSLSDFDGSSSRSFVSWLYGVKCCFKKQCLSDSRKCELVVSCLKGVALLWYNTLNFSRRMKGKGMIQSWHKLEPHMKEKYALSCTFNKLKAGLYSLKQNLLSVSKSTKPCEMNQPMCERNLELKLEIISPCHEPKPKILEQTDLGIACPLGKVNCVSGSYTVGYLNSIKNESMSRGGDDESPTPSFTNQLELSNTDITPNHYDSKNQVPNLSPMEVSSNHMLFECQAQQNDQSIPHFTTEFHESSVKHGSREGPYFPICPRVCHLTSGINPYPIFETCVVRGKSPDLSTPHFYYYMLMRLMTKLGKMSPCLHPLTLRNVVLNLGMEEQIWFGKMHVDEYFRHLKVVCCVPLELREWSFIPELCILRIAKWNLFQSGCMSPTIGYCSDLKVMFVWGHDSRKPGETCEIPFASVITGFLSKINDNSTLVGPCELLTGLQNSSVNLRFLNSNAITVNPHLGLSLNYDNATFPREFGCTSEIPSCIEMGCLGSRESLHYLGVFPKVLNRPLGEPWLKTNIMLLMGTWEAKTKIKREATHSENKPTHSKRSRPFLLIFDPGGRGVIAAHEVITVLLIKPNVRNFFSYIQNLRSNFFQPGEAAAGAMG